MSGKAAKRARRGVSDEVDGFLRRILGQLRALLKRQARRTIAANPDHRRPCHTCAFNPATDMDRGFQATIWGLAQSLVKGQPFYCHENLPREQGDHGEWLFDPTVARPCAGWAMLAYSDALPDARRAIMRGIAGCPLTNEAADLLLVEMAPVMPEVYGPTMAPGADLSMARARIDADRP